MKSLSAGDRVSEYVLDKPVGLGSFGQVWKAHHHIWKDQVVAIKIPTDTQFVRNLQKEGTAIHGLRHPNVVRAIGLDPYADVPYFVMEFIDGCSLRELVDENKKGMPIRTAQNITVGILEALEAAHKNNVIHHDIKPANILIHGGGQKPIESITVADVKVTDFGLGKAGEITTQSIMQSGSMLSEEGRSISGTLAYMSPEQRDGAVTDARSDLYSVGIVLFELMCGERPSGGDMPSHIRDGLPSWVDRVYQRLYTRHDRRFASATEVLREIESKSVPPRVVEEAYSNSPRRDAHGLKSVGIGQSPARCPACNTRIERGDNFCIMCGEQATTHPRRCTNCNGYPAPDDRFCIFCGTPLPETAR